MGDPNDATPIPNEHRLPPTVKGDDTHSEPAPAPRPLLVTTPEPAFDPVLRTRSLLPEAPPPKPPRLLSLDVFRGLIMILLASHALDIPALIKGPFQNSPAWKALAYQLDHPEFQWVSCTLWDMIQPCFMFMVGVAIPYSYASRKVKGERDNYILLHTVWRSLLLVALGVFLASDNRPETQFIFTNVLAQIGLGYTFVFLMLKWPRWLQWLAVVGIAVGYWTFFVTPPSPKIAAQEQAEDDSAAAAAVVLQTDPLAAATTAAYVSTLPHDGPWRKGRNAAARFDAWFLNLFPRDTSKHELLPANRGGYTTLNFVPSMATMLLGLIAGQWLRGPSKPWTKLVLLVIGGSVCVAAGYAVGIGPDGPWSESALCPLVKRIWTPSWAVFSGGLAMLILAGIYLIVDLVGLRWWTFPFVVVGMNSIAMYLMGQLLRGWTRGMLGTHLASKWLQDWCRSAFGYGFYRDVYAWSSDPADLKKMGNHVFNGAYGPLFESLLILGVFYLVCLWMYRRKIFLKV